MESVNINGKDYFIELILKNSGRSASARLRDGKIVIRIPKRASDKQRSEIYENLKRRSIHSIEKGKWLDKKKLELQHGQRISIMGKEYELQVISGKKRRLRLNGDAIIARTPDGTNGVGEKLGALFLPRIKTRVDELNAMHFGSEITSVSLRNNKIRWGSCSANGKISLSTRLLFVPSEVLDYVIIHELAHTKIKSHGKGFWQIVENAMPDHAEMRAWLRKNDHEIPVIKC